MSKNERILLWSTAAAALVLRALLFFRYRFDADEQHHAHVAWGWTAGMVPYRDFFDNHAPLFHMLTAPWLAMFGERADILFWMRVPMIALFAWIVYATWLIGRQLYDARVAAWAALLLALFPPFFLKSLEFRTDNLWTALWMLAIVLLLRQRRAFLVGLVLGGAFAVSMKTTLLVFTLVAAWVITRLFVTPREQRTAFARRFVEALAGFLVIPALLAIFFAEAGAWDALVYCTLAFNANLSKTRNNLWIARAIFPFTAAAVVWSAWRFRRTANAWRYFLAVAMGVFTVTLAGFWILISPRDFLPLMPLAAVFVAAFLTRTRVPVRSFAIVIVLCVAALWYYADRFANRTAWHTTMMDQALRLSRPGELIIDLKGETIFRHRPFYYALEAITRAQISRGIIRDTLAEDVVRTRTHIAQADGPMWPPRGRAFLSENFVNLGRLRASGQAVGEDGTFTIGVPGEYVIVSKNGEARGVLDGSPYLGARELAAGAHRFDGEKDVTALWAPAFRRGHSPYHLRDLKF